MWLEYAFPALLFHDEVWPYLKKSGNAGRARNEKCGRPRVQGRVHEERASPKIC